MKKVAHILLICIYLLATMGFSINQFYCCGKLRSIAVTFSQDTQQKCAKRNEKSGCCQNKYQFFKVSDKHVTSHEISSRVTINIDLHLFTLPFQHIIFSSQNITIANRSNAPPLHPEVPIYIYNCVFRI